MKSREDSEIRMILNRSRLLGIVAAGAMLAMALPGSALAHERRTIANGKYDVVVGWNVEPAYSGMMNGATIRIMNAGTTTPVTGAEKTLKLDKDTLTICTPRTGFEKSDGAKERPKEFKTTEGGTIFVYKRLEK